MEKDLIEQRLACIVEDLAEVEHQRWSHWQSYMHSKGVRQPDGTMLIPAEFVRRWDQEIETAYGSLTEDQKESDREQVRKYLPIIVKALGQPED